MGAPCCSGERRDVDDLVVVKVESLQARVVPDSFGERRDADDVIVVQVVCLQARVVP